ncbi:ImmA/IrrE family metallo-endopeptidase [Salidesulfovibrio brasiliensis]|uniref:ImmA/IrrE family metallo-endopeptidase n=1 Tax=Salidesulfovibrio brasiliensis TaxID=221711 RepID=UPI0006CFCE16|nr:ImmA/IrrE family metallo-endopeptidase [Salidesulfovibrio brasiliensis]
MDYSKQEVIEVAQGVRDNYFHSDYSWDGLQNLLNDLGGELVYVDSDDLEESLLIHGDGSFTIYLPHHTSDRRDYFTIAHELGHYFLHWEDDGEETPFCRGESNLVEWQANWFAAELLMPTDEFTEAAEECGNDVNELADQFGVSRSAVSVRLEVLDLD